MNRLFSLKKKDRNHNALSTPREYLLSLYSSIIVLALQSSQLRCQDFDLFTRLKNNTWLIWLFPDSYTIQRCIFMCMQGLS